MRITDEQKSRVNEVFLYQYETPKEEWNAEDKPDLSTEEKDAYWFVVDCLPNVLKRPFPLYISLVETLLDLYQKGEDYELWYTRHYEDLRELDAKQLGLLSTRIEILAKELEEKEAKSGRKEIKEDAKT